MEEKNQTLFCTKLIAVEKFENQILSGTHETHMNLTPEISVTIYQAGLRKIILESSFPVKCDEFYKHFEMLEKLIMLFDGWFVPIHILELYNGDITTTELQENAKQYLKHRLKYCNAADLFRGSYNVITRYSDFINDTLYSKWNDILSKLDIIHNMILYCTADIGLPVDVRCAHIIESFESLSELISEYNKSFSVDRSNSRSNFPALKNCLSAVIIQYGMDIFNNEYSNDWECFLQTMVNSRKRIMHIKRNYTGKYFNGIDSVFYSQKLMLLYRRVLIELIGVDYSYFKDRIIEMTKEFDEWYYETINKTPV